jgi:hypothetical protein
MKKNPMPSILKKTISKSDEEHDVEYEDTLIPLNDGPGESTSWCTSSDSSLVGDEEVTEMSLNTVDFLRDKSKLLDQRLSVEESDEEEMSDTDSIKLVGDWDRESDSQSDTDSYSAENRKVQPILSSLLAKREESDEHFDDNVLQFGRETQHQMEKHTPAEDMEPSVQVDVPDHIWKSPEFLKRKTVKEMISKSKSKEKVDSPSSGEEKDDDRLEMKVKDNSSDDSSSDSGLSGNGSVLSIPEGQLQAPLFSPNAKPQGMATPLGTSVPHIPNFASPQGKTGKKKLGKKQYDQEASIRPSTVAEGISRYNPLFYHASKQAPLVDRSYRSKKERIQAKKERKKLLAEERKRNQEFNKKLDQFFAFGGLAGDVDKEEEAEDTEIESTDPQSEDTESEKNIEGTSTDGSESDFFDDDSIDLIEGHTNVKKSSRKKKEKKGKKTNNKKKKVEKKRGRRTDYEIDDTTLEMETHSIPVAERVEAIFNNKELIFQQDEIPQQQETKKSDTSSRSKSKTRVRSKPQTSSYSVGPLKGGVQHTDPKKRSNSGGNLMTDPRPVLSGRRSNSVGSMKRHLNRKQEGGNIEGETGDPSSPPKGRPSRSNSGGSGKSSNTRRNSDEVARNRSNSTSDLFSTVTTRKERSKAAKLSDGWAEADDPRRALRKKRSCSVDGLSRSSHGAGEVVRSRQRRPERTLSMVSREIQARSSSKSPSAGRSTRVESERSVERDNNGNTKKPMSSREARSGSKSPSAMRRKGIESERPVEQDNNGSTKKPMSSREARSGSKSPSAMRRKGIESERPVEQDNNGNTKKPMSSREARSGSKSPSAFRRKRVDLGESKKSGTKQIVEEDDTGSPDEALRRTKVASTKEQKLSRSKRLQSPSDSKEPTRSRSKELRYGVKPA